MNDDLLPSTVRFWVDSAHAMQALAARLGSALVVGDVVALTGPLGAGKTTFVQGLAEGMGVPAERHVASPTFALVNEHPGRVHLVHVDFYRISSTAELPELGIEEAYDRAATAIEWADKFSHLLPGDALHVAIEVHGDARELHVRGHGPRSQRMLAALAPEMVKP
jgi:tRNA threonylcarbamoyladenosine biosynthesis protein TsaE